jgi:hypothetical protein
LTIIFFATIIANSGKVNGIRDYLDMKLAQVVL